MTTSSVVVIGGGIAGLAAAYELTGGAAGPGPHTPRVEVIESQTRWGGSLATAEFAGRTLDLGADGFLARRPEVVDLVRDLGQEADLEPIAASGAWLYLRGRLCALPEGLVLGVPTHPSQIRDVPGLTWRSKWAAWRDFHFPHRFHPGEDATIGEITRAKLGNELTYQFIEPMIGGIQAGRVDELSARSVFPALLEAARRGGSLLKEIGTGGPANPGPVSASRPSGPAFFALRGGTGSLPARLVDELTRRGVVLRPGVTVTRLRRVPEDRPWRVDTDTTTTPADAVILATPAAATARLLSDLPAVALLARVRTAGAAMVTLRLARSTGLPATGTGILVPLRTPWRDGGTFMTTAVTFLDRKWPHLATNDDVVLRIHVGRIDDDRWVTISDDDLAERVARELSVIIGAPVEPLEWRVQRWPAGLPQYEVGHDELVERAKEAARGVGVALAGNAYDGVGIPASIGSGRRAAREVLAALA